MAVRWALRQPEHQSASGIPLDSKASNPRLLSEHISSHTFHIWFRRGLVVELLGIVFIVNIVADADELSVVVTTSEEDDCHAQDFCSGDAAKIRGIGFEDEFVHADGDGANEEGIELLVVL